MITKICKFNDRNNIFTPLNAYLLVIYLIGSYLIYQASAHWYAGALWFYMLWILFATAAEFKPIIFSFGRQLTVSYAVHVSALILFGAPVAILMSTVSNIIVDLVGKRGLKKTLFNISQYAITIQLSWLVYHYFARYPTSFDIKENFLAILLSCVIYVIVNYMLVCIVISLSIAERLYTVIIRDIKLELLHFALLMPLNLLIIVCYTSEPISVIFVILPLAMAQFSFENYFALRTATKSTIEVLAQIIDQRDSYTSEHSFRVADYCKIIAQELCLSVKGIEILVTAARVHDLGKISVPDSILLKNGPLTAAEREIMSNHSLAGYQILSKLEFYKSGAKLVLYHHERYDGKGYPKGLRGENIPFGARILAVADSYDAMTSDRPYRKAMSTEEAIKELVKCSGTQFDSQVVEAFLKIINREAGKGLA